MRALIAVAAVVFLTGCASTQESGTLAPTPTLRPSPSAARSASPGATATASASAAPSASPGEHQGLLTVNAGPGGVGSLPSAWSFQVQYPARYLVTDDWMLTDFQNQGGLASPRLVFTLGSQVMGLKVIVDELLTARNQDCIMIWSTRGFASIADWEDNILVPRTGPLSVVSERSQELGAFTYIVREMAPPGGGSHVFEASVQLSDDLSYFFNTCTADSQADLLTILQTFKVRRPVA